MANNLADAGTVFNKMIDRELEPDIVFYTVLIATLSKRNNLMGVFNEMIDRGLEPDTVFYTVLIARLCYTNNLVDALIVFDEMIDRGLEPNIVIYKALLCGCPTKKDVDKYLSLFAE